MRNTNFSVGSSLVLLKPDGNHNWVENFLKTRKKCKSKRIKTKSCQNHPRNCPENYEKIVKKITPQNCQRICPTKIKSNFPKNYLTKSSTRKFQKLPKFCQMMHDMKRNVETDFGS